MQFDYSLICRFILENPLSLKKYKYKTSIAESQDNIKKLGLSQLNGKTAHSRKSMNLTAR